MKIVLRNTAVRKDAAYVIVVDEAGTLTGHWGRWPTYQAKGVSGLRRQVKSAEGLVRLLNQKLDKGYVPVEVLDAPDWVTAMFQRSGVWPGDSVSSVQLEKPKPAQSLPTRPRTQKRSRAAALEL